MKKSTTFAARSDSSSDAKQPGSEGSPGGIKIGCPPPYGEEGVLYDFLRGGAVEAATSQVEDQGRIAPMQLLQGFLLPLPDPLHKLDIFSPGGAGSAGRS